MPYRIKKKTYKPKRVHKRKAKYVKISRGVPSGMSSTQVANLRYAFSTSLTATTTLAGSAFRCNSCFDPEVSLGGHQPMGYTTWSSLYNHYVVLGSKITIRWVSPDANTTPSICGVYTTDTETFPYSDAGGFMEARRGMTRDLPSGNTRQITTVGKYSPKKFFNIKDVKDNLLRLGALVGADPSEEAYYMVWLQAHTGTVTWYLTISIDYIVLFSEPKDLAQS